jgi:hypothetical protein
LPLRGLRDKPPVLAYHLIDAPALMAVKGCCDPDQFPELLVSLSELVEDGKLRFPRAVINELQVYARGEQVTAWAIGIGKKVRDYAAYNEDKLAIMHMIQLDLGYDSGLEDMDGGEPAIIDLAAAGHMFESRNTPFWMISEDCGTAPLRPTMEEICQFRSWPMLSASDGLKSLGLEQYLRQ